MSVFHGTPLPLVAPDDLPPMTPVDLVASCPAGALRTTHLRGGGRMVALSSDSLHAALQHASRVGISVTTTAMVARRRSHTCGVAWLPASVLLIALSRSHGEGDITSAGTGKARLRAPATA